jgi:hypothetical protein
VITAHTQLRLARPLAADLRRPWERPAAPGRLTPARVRRSFRNIRARTVLPAGAPNPPTHPPEGRVSPPTETRGRHATNKRAGDRAPAASAG